MVSRRSLLKTGMRTGVCGMFALAFAATAAKRKKLEEQGLCTAGLCKSCGIFNQCTLPQAEEARQNVSSEANG